MAYYFLVASLPTLSPDGPLPMTGEQFLQFCEDDLGRRDYEDVRYIINYEPWKSKSPFVRKWLERDTLLRNAIARARAEKLGADPEPFLRYAEFFETYPDEAVADVMRGGSDSQAQETTPLQREAALDRARWMIIEELAGFDAFSAEAVLAYALKFNIVRRWAGLETDKGRAVVTKFIEESFASRREAS